MATRALKALTEGSNSFGPQKFFDAWNQDCVPQDNDFRTSIIRSFGLTEKDDYTYHAIASVNLAQVQAVIKAGGVNGMHAWYRDEQKTPVAPPPQQDIEAYTQIFSPSTSTVKAISSLAANAKKESLRATIAAHLLSRLQLPTSSTSIVLPKGKKDATLINPYLDIWAWSCRNLEWAGPTPETADLRQSHHILPVLYHHFGCVCPTYDALRVIEQLSTSKKIGNQALLKARPVVEIGSGNGYWTLILRQMGLRVFAIDNGLSLWRTMWIDDTIMTDGIEFLKKPPSQDQDAIGSGGKNSILLLVYPQVSADFTGKVIGAYDGEIVVVAGTQNRNGYTGFRDQVIDEWMEAKRGDFKKLLQIPLPSFAGKDEALFVFCRQSGEGHGK